MIFLAALADFHSQRKLGSGKNIKLFGILRKKAVQPN